MVGDTEHKYYLHTCMIHRKIAQIIDKLSFIYVFGFDIFQFLVEVY